MTGTKESKLYILKRAISNPAKLVSILDTHKLSYQFTEVSSQIPLNAYSHIMISSEQLRSWNQGSQSIGTLFIMLEEHLTTDFLKEIGLLIPSQSFLIWPPTLDSRLPFVKKILQAFQSRRPYPWIGQILDISLQKLISAIERTRLPSTSMDSSTLFQTYRLLYMIERPTIKPSSIIEQIAIIHHISLKEFSTLNKEILEGVENLRLAFLKAVI